MIELQFRDQIYTYDVYHIVKAFLPEYPIAQEVDECAKFLVRITVENGGALQIEPGEIDETKEKRERKSYVNQKIYGWLSKITGKQPAWGILTGIRPTKLAMELLEKQVPDDEIIRNYEKRYLVTNQKAKLGLAIAKKEQKQLSRLDYKEGYSLYVGIPFCPTTCAYCSFTSYPIAKWKDKTELYLDALFKELSYIAEVSKGKKLNTIYVGGGTPTALEADQLHRLLTHLEAHFPYEDLQEMTVEAGRPDSITKEKLQVLKAHSINRISINPQTMQQKTLDIIGRKHTVEAVSEAFYLAREIGFSNINMDLIAGLPGETLSDMEDTLKQIQLLDPDSITVHALAIKRASKFGMEYQERMRKGEAEPDYGKQAQLLSSMIELAAVYAGDMEMDPYYLYRQKNIAGNFENVGYAKVDKAGIYNILIMEEKQSIIAAGAGVSTKVVYPEVRYEGGKGSKIVRVENVKEVSQYIERVDEMIERKGELLWH